MSWVLFLGIECQGVKLNTHFHLVVRLRMGRGNVSTPLNGFMAWTKQALNFYLNVVRIQGKFLILGQKISYGDFTWVFIFI